MTPRDQISLRLSKDGLEKIRVIMADTKATRSEVVRRLLSEALASDQIVKAAKAKLVDL